jgi:TctA family transporter
MMPRTDTTWIAAAAKFGVPSVIAVFLIWWLTSVVSASLTSIQSTLGDHVTTSNFYLRQVCINTAKDETQRTSCLSPEARH